MKPISELISTPRPSNGVNSPFAEQIEHVIALMGEDNSQFKNWCGRLRRFKDRPDEIYRMIREAQDKDNPPAFFEWSLKKTR